MRRWIIIVAAGTTCLINVEAHAQPDKVLYELQERCGKQAAGVFRSEWKSNVLSDKDGVTIGNYENHYSPRLNKCFYLEVHTFTSKKRDGFASTSLRLYDLNENKEYGSFMSSTGGMLECQVQGKTCRSEQEWRELAKPFLED